MVKQMYCIDKENVYEEWVVGAMSKVYKNLRIPFSETEKCNTAAYIECIIGRYSYWYSSTSTGTRTRTL